jgi:protein-tyrosine phosphatase
VLVRQRQKVQALSRRLSAAQLDLHALAGEERVLDWEGLLNARDTGGLPTADGGRVRRAALVRSDVLSRLTESGRAALVAHGVRTIIDVRGTSEAASDRDAYPTWDGAVTYLNIPYNTWTEGAVVAEMNRRYDSAQSREELNRLDVDLHLDGVAAIVGAIADADPGGVLVHCHAGKDRTGATIALVLSLVGVSDEDIADDYALTALNLEPLIIEWLDTMSADEAERERLRKLAWPSREAMLDTLAYLRERYGGAENYLLAAGVTHEQIERIKQRLVEHVHG